MKKTNIFLSLFMVFLIVFGITSPIINSCESISNKIFRLHIMANSDSSEDQALKLKVRDCILAETANIFNGKTIDDNIKIAENNIDYITNICNDCIKNEGYDYSVNVNIVKEFFETRVYDDFTLPAGIYNSLKIEIGEANGHNWWCIVFPAVCISACSQSMNDYLTQEEMQIIESGYTPKFKVIEIYEKIKNRINSK